MVKEILETYRMCDMQRVKCVGKDQCWSYFTYGQIMGTSYMSDYIFHLQNDGTNFRKGLLNCRSAGPIILFLYRPTLL